MKMALADQPLTDKQHETFARNVADGYSLTEAAKRAEFPELSAHNIGSRLMKHPQIQQRVEELRNSKESSRVAREAWLIQELKETHRLAREAKQYGICVQALVAIARIEGLGLLNEGERTKNRRTDAVGLQERLREGFAQLSSAEREKFLLEAPTEIREMLTDVDKTREVVAGQIGEMLHGVVLKGPICQRNFRGIGSRPECTAAPSEPSDARSDS